MHETFAGAVLGTLLIRVFHEQALREEGHTYVGVPRSKHEGETVRERDFLLPAWKQPAGDGRKHTMPYRYPQR